MDNTTLITMVVGVLIYLGVEAIIKIRKNRKSNETKEE